MSFYIAAKKDTHEVLEIGSNSLDMSVSSVLNDFISALENNYHPYPSSLEVYHEETSSDEASMVMDGGSYSLEWDGDTITGIDISEELAKYWLNFETNKTEIMADNVEEALVKVRILAADKLSTVSVSPSLNIPFTKGATQISIRFNFINGVSSRFVKSSTVEDLSSTRQKRFGDYRIDNNITIQSVM